MLVNPGWLWSKIDKSTHADPKFLIFEAGTHTGDYESAHIPGAVFFNTNAVEKPPTWNRLPNDELEPVLLRYGVTADHKVVVYGRNTIWAARIGLILLFAGVKEVRLLDGGWAAWDRAGLPAEATVNLPVSVPSFGGVIPGRPDLLIDSDGVQEVRTTSTSLLVSVRSWPEFIGSTSGYDFIPQRGRIPGAIWGGGGKDKDSMSHYRKPDGTAKSLQDIARAWRARGITPNKRVVFYCGTGWRASEAWFYAAAMGWQNIGVYDGGWFEWSSDSGNPIERGIPKNKL